MKGGEEGEGVSISVIVAFSDKCFNDQLLVGLFTLITFVFNIFIINIKKLKKSQSVHPPSLLLP